MVAPSRSHSRVQHVLRIETQISMSKREKTAHHQAGAGQEHDREGNFGDHQTGAELPVAKTIARAFAAAGEANLRVAANGVKRGCKTANEHGKNGDGKREEQDGGIQTDHSFL